jgi:uncharacterized protein
MSILTIEEKGTLETLVYVADSEIHGKGLFARKRIRAGTVIGRIQGERTKRDGPHVLWITPTTGIKVNCMLKYINHSPAPNAIYYDTREVVALRTIARDEEITHDYDQLYD